MNNVVSRGICLMTQFFIERQVPDHHGWKHVIEVYNHAFNSLEEEKELDENTKIAILLAALCHENQDKKLFAPNLEEPMSNTRVILEQLPINKELYPLIYELISLTSVSKRGLNKPTALDSWKFICSDADRIEALGEIGIRRCIEYTYDINRPVVAPSTPLPQNEEELWRIATLDRLQQFVNRGGTSDSALDHFYDKLLHIHKMESGNPYLDRIALERHQVMVDFVLKLTNFIQTNRPPLPLMRLPEF